MAIPDYEALMLPLLRAVADGQEHRMKILVRGLADQFGLTDEERERRLPSGQQTVIANRIGWARTYLLKAGLLEFVRRGFVRISEAGRRVLEHPPDAITARYLMQFPSFAEFTNGNSKAEAVDDTTEINRDATPEELLESAYLDLRTALADDLLEQVKRCSSAFFERLVVELLVAMGYGGSIEDAGKAIGKSGDDGIDGLINEDRLGLDVVCIQAKRWRDTRVGRPEVQAFAGSMEGNRAKKGVLITTSKFSRDALEYVNRIERRIVLIDGQRLSELMIDFGIGVATTRQYALKRIDSDYFDEDLEGTAT